MTIYLILRITAVGIIVFVLNQVLDQTGKKDYSMFVNLGGIILVLYWIIPYIAELIKYIQGLFEL